MSPRTLVSALAAIGALIVAAWFYLGTRQTSDLAAANAIVNSSGAKLSPRQADRALTLLDSAARLNPDRTVDLVRSRVHLEAGNRPLAHRNASAVTRAEPMNATAWQYYAQSALNRRQTDRAISNFARLDPNAAR